MRTGLGSRMRRKLVPRQKPVVRSHHLARRPRRLDIRPWLFSGPSLLGSEDIVAPMRGAIAHVVHGTAKVARCNVYWACRREIGP
ncbi:hypothetical protein MTO96_047012 [Rhipicephalus appendiculatus]